MPNPPFALDNRGKRSLVLDLQDRSGRDTFDRLLERSDVFLTNLRPRALERLGVDHTAISSRHPRLVYASVTGYGLTGEDRDRPGYDIGAFGPAPGSLARSCRLTNRRALCPPASATTSPG